MRKILLSLILLLFSCASTPTPVDFEKPSREWPEEFQPKLGQSADNPRTIEKMDQLIAKLLVTFKGDKQKLMEYLLAEGATSFQSKDYGEAMKYYNYSWWLNRTDYRSYWGMGKVLSKNDHIDKAIELYDQALELSPTDFTFYNNFSVLVVSKWRKSPDQRYMSKAEALLNESISLDPNDAEAYVLLSLALSAQGKIIEAKLTLESAQRAKNKTKLSQDLIELQSKMLAR